MNLQELYAAIDGDYTHAAKVLRMDKLIDKHIRKLPGNNVVSGLVEAGRAMDATAIFENAHAMKGVCSNLGLTKLAEAATLLSDEFRPGTPRELTDSEVAEKIDEIEAQFNKTIDVIEQYASS
ncbi:MAG: Hpt domain-containing protein [Clostridia bacterium]|nr:Hpt domain-containing protein [Clostridia bacterium]